MSVEPVTLPPGWCKLATTPVATGSAAPTMTIGMVSVAFIVARVACVPCATTTAGFMRMTSAGLRGQVRRRHLSEIHDQILALYVSELGKSFGERLCVSTTNPQDANPVDLPGSLPARDDRNGDRAEPIDEKRPPVHYSITWSARSSSDCGMLSPRARALLRFSTNSNFVGCSIGRSPGLAPLKILAT